MKSRAVTARLAAVSVGMAITVSCNTVLASLYAHVDGATVWLPIGIAGACMAVVVLCFAELASRFPGAIGIRAFTKAAFGDRVSLAATLFYIALVLIAGGLEIYLCHSLLAVLLPAPAAAAVLAGLLLVVVGLNLRGVDLSLRAQVALTSAVAASLLMLAGMALGEVDAAAAVERAPFEVQGLLQAVPRALFLFVGIEWAVLQVPSHAAFRRELPRALLGAIVAVALLYGCFGMALRSHLAPPALVASVLPHLDLARSLGSPIAMKLTAGVSLLAVLSAFNAGLAGASRIVYSLAREGQLPAWFCRLRGPSLCPSNAVLALASAVLPVAWLMSVDGLRACVAPLFGLHLAIVYGAVLLAWLRLRHRAAPRLVRQPVNRLLVLPVLAVMGLTTAGMLLDPGAATLRAIVLAEAAGLALVCGAVFRFQALKSTGTP